MSGRVIRILMTSEAAADDARDVIQRGLEVLMRSHARETPNSAAVWIEEIAKFRLYVEVKPAEVAAHLRRIADEIDGGAE